MKNIKFLVAFVLITAMLAVSAFAAVSLDFDVEDATTDTGAACYKVVVTQSDDEGDWRALQTKVKFNNEKIIPVDWYDGSVPDYSSAANGAEYPFTFGSFTSGRTSTAELTRPGAPEWTINGANSEVVVELSWGYVDTYPITASKSLIYEMYFKLADGVALTDIYEDDFNVYYVKYANGADNYFGYTDESKNNIVLANNVVNEAPVATEYWNAGNGYNLVDIDNNKVADNSPVTKSGETETAVTVKYGGYYQGTANWSGAALKEAVTVDGLEIEVTYTALPSSTDCWAYIGVLADPSIFSTTTPYNNGYVNLIRYYDDNLAVYGTTAWTPAIGTYGAGEGFFAIEAGDTLRVCFDKNAEGTYDITYVKNGAEFFQLPVALDLEAALGGTTGYPVVSASCKGSEAGAFEYTVDVAPAEIKVAEIPVAAGDTVYEYTADGSSYTATEIDADGTYNVLVPESDEDVLTVIVNSGYTAQKGYNVGIDLTDYFDEAGAAANGVLGSNEESMRADDPQGIRFFGTVSNAITAYISEYGFIMTAESAYNNLGEDYVLDMALVEEGKAKKGVAYDGNGTDLYFSRNDATTVIAGVLYGIPKTAEGVQTIIVSRPYYKAGNAYVYGEENAATLYDIAKKLLEDDAYEAVWEYAQEIVDLVDGTEPELPELTTEIAIDVSSLYE